MHSSGLPGSSVPSLPGWYEIYFAAVRETDERKAQIQLEHAAKTLEDRIVQLRDAAPNHRHELDDLGCALTYVRLLLMAPSALVRSPSVGGPVHTLAALMGTTNICRSH